MKETLLIIALVIAILFDAVRIYQYIKMRKVINQADKEVFFLKVEKLHNKWLSLPYTVGSFINYLRNHWEDKE